MKSILLIQARDEPHMLEQEQQCFLDRCQVDPHLLVPINATTDDLKPIRPSDYSAIMIGGAGAYSAVNTYEWTEDLLNIVRECIDLRVPTFGSCWGHQVIARAAGGTVIHDSNKSEMGCVSIDLTDAGVDDPVFRFMPRQFNANAGHHDRVTALPASGVELARNGSQPNQAFRILDRPIYGTQFHSELDAKAEHERLIEYRAHYRKAIPSDEAFQAVIDGLVQTTEADKLLRYFLDAFVI